VEENVVCQYGRLKEEYCGGRCYVSIWNTEGIILWGELLRVNMEHWRNNTVGGNVTCQYGTLKE